VWGTFREESKLEAVVAAMERSGYPRGQAR
jgi:hypothetical protein